MKTINLKRSILIIATIFSMLQLFSIKEYNQIYPIGDVNFVPPNPQPGDTLKLYLSFFPFDKEKIEVAIKLITWTDINEDCKYTKPGEEVEHAVIKVKDNEKGKDEAVSEKEILISIYNVPIDHPPRKYTAIVTSGKDSKSASIIVPSKETTVCNPDNISSNWSLRKVLYIPYEVAKKLTFLKDILKRGSVKDLYHGEHSLYVYTLKGKKLERITYSDKTYYLSPTWSFDSEKLAFIINHGGKREIAWTGIEVKDIHIITTGPNDSEPFWLPGNTHIIFLRDNYLHIVNTNSKEVKAIAEDVWIDHILAISQGTENTVQVIYEAPNKYTAETKEVYLLELDSQFNQKNVIHLVNDPIWFLITAVSPSGNQMIYSDQDILFISLINGEKVERLFEDEYRYYQPSWSPDGNKIAFVSNRP